jgi:hypothetical protein
MLSLTLAAVLNAGNWRNRELAGDRVGSDSFNLW